ncbi:LysR substrate-binding domain-containing protein [Embleya sp. AB8]|uniref:LysR substrate-binding domain-containing protein n=1 Tax=Embleya sp. AB8 TaxID=3156304 RepID=UPI003C7455C4
MDVRLLRALVAVAADGRRWPALADRDPPPADPVGVAAWVRGRPVVRLTRAEGPGLVRQIELFQGGFDARPELVQEASDLQTVLALIAAGVGAALLPAGAADIASPTVAVTRIESDAASWRIGAIWDSARATRVRDDFLAVAYTISRTRRPLRRVASTGTTRPLRATRRDRRAGREVTSSPGDPGSVPGFPGNGIRPLP